MDHQPPLDQLIVDEYFRLASNRKTKDIAWLYGMIATYGLKPKDFYGFNWNNNYTLTIPAKKRTLRPLHPQWVFLFRLKEKQPHRLWGRWSLICASLYEAMAFQDVNLNITDLLLAYRIRKNNSVMPKQKQASFAVLATVS